MFDEFSAYNRNNIGYGDVVTYKIADEEEQGSDINEERDALPDDVDNLDISQYNEIHLNYAEQARIQSEALTWDAKHRNVPRIRTLSNEITYLYVIDDDGIVHVYSAEKSKNIHDWKKDYGNTNSTQIDSFVEERRTGRGDDSRDSDYLQNGREPTETNRRDTGLLRGEGQHNRGDYPKNDNVSNSRKKAGIQKKQRKVIGFHEVEDGLTEYVYSDGTTERLSLPDEAVESPTLSNVNKERERYKASPKDKVFT